jgi:hypothetical protein
VLYQLKVTEPESRRILREEDSTAGVVTTFTVDPLNGGDLSKVTIKTTAQTSPGLRGWLEQLMTPAITRRIYREELALLADLASH